MAHERGSSRVIAVVQARMGSTRLPGKVLADIGGRPALDLLLARMRRSLEVAEVVLATSESSADDPIARMTASTGVAVVRGPLDDVLERYRLAGAAHGAEAVVRVTGDCPLIDSEVVDAVVRRWRRGSEQYVSNVIAPRTFPDGMDTEVISWPALVDAAQSAHAPHEREHVTPFILAHPERYPQAGVYLDPPRGGVRITLDTADDLQRMRRVVERAGAQATLAQILEALGEPAESWRVRDAP